MGKLIYVSMLFFLGLAQPVHTMENPVESLNKAECDLSVAVYQGSTGLVEVLLDNGADPNSRRLVDHCPILSRAVSLGRFDICKLLIDRGANVNAQDNLGRTALIEALLTSHLRTPWEIYKLLIQNGADFNITDNERNTVLILAAQKGLQSQCIFFVNAQKERLIENKRTLLLCLNRTKNLGEPCLTLLYTHRNVLVHPYLNCILNETSELLNFRDKQGNRAYDYLQIPELNPE